MKIFYYLALSPLSMQNSKNKFAEQNRKHLGPPVIM